MSLLILALISSPVFADGASSAKTPPFKMTLKDGKLTSQIHTAPLRKVIEEISRLAGAEVRWLTQDEDFVSAEFADLPLDEALEMILKKNFTLSYDFTGNNKKLTGIWVASRSESMQTFEATNNFSRIKQPYLENGLDSERAGMKKDVTAKIEGKGSGPELMPVRSGTEIDLAEAPPSARSKAVESPATQPDNDQTAKPIPSQFASTNSPQQVGGGVTKGGGEMASSVLISILSGMQ
jgi:hypothetical protein